MTQAFTDRFDQLGSVALEESDMRTPLMVTRKEQIPNGRGGFTETPVTYGPFNISYTPIVNAQMPRVIEDQAQGRIAYWLKYPLGLDIRPDDELLINGHVYTLATEFDPPPHPHAQIAVMWRKQD